MRNIFLQKSYTKGGRETMTRLFLKLSISLDQYSKVLYSLLLLHAQVEDYRNILKLNCRPFAFTTYEDFLKNKKWSGTSFLASFSAWFSKKSISRVILCYLNKCCPYLVR